MKIKKVLLTLIVVLSLINTSYGQQRDYQREKYKKIKAAIESHVFKEYSYQNLFALEEEIDYLQRKNSNRRISDKEINLLREMIQKKKDESLVMVENRFKEVKFGISNASNEEEIQKYVKQGAKYWFIYDGPHGKEEISKLVYKRREELKNKSKIVINDKNNTSENSRNKKNNASRSFDWELIHTEPTINFYLHDRLYMDNRLAVVSAIHDKDKNTTLFQYNKVYYNAFKLKENIDEKLKNTLLSKIKNKHSQVYTIRIHNYLKDFQLPKFAYEKNKWKGLNEGDIITLLYKYSKKTGWTNKVTEQIDYNSAMTYNEAQKLREKENKTPTTYKERDAKQMRVINASRGLIENYDDTSEDSEKSRKAAEKAGFVYFDSDYWNNYGKYQNGTNHLEKGLFRNIFHGNFEKVKYLIRKEQSKKNAVEQFLTQNSNINFIVLFESFVMNYSSQCKQYLPPNYNTLELQSKNEWGNSTPYGKVFVDRRFTSTFQAYYPTYSDTFKKALDNDTGKFIRENGCDCKAVNQLAENLLRYAKNEKSVQQSGKSLKGKDCD